MVWYYNKKLKILIILLVFFMLNPISVKAEDRRIIKLNETNPKCIKMETYKQKNIKTFNQKNTPLITIEETFGTEPISIKLNETNPKCIKMETYKQKNIKTFNQKNTPLITIEETFGTKPISYILSYEKRK